VVDLVSNLALPQTIIGRCPGCFDNFRKAFCEIACSEKQSDFMEASKTVKNDQGRFFFLGDVMLT
jgi:hypothetical protein